MADKAEKQKKKMEIKRSKAAKKLAPIVFEDMAEGTIYHVRAGRGMFSTGMHLAGATTRTRHNIGVARHEFIVKVCPAHLIWNCI